MPLATPPSSCLIRSRARHSIAWLKASTWPSEDDPRRAACATLECLALPEEQGFLEPLQIGIGRGVLCVGVCGGSIRRTYGAIGDESAWPRGWSVAPCRAKHSSVAGCKPR